MTTRLLLIEDNIDVRLAVEDALSMAGFDVISVETVRSARRLLETQEFGIVLTDGALPDGTGIDVADEATARGIPVLIVTGHLLELPVSKYPHVLKPVRPKALVEQLKQLLAQREGGAEVLPFQRP
jgi:DNA-binding NtrC family response regulator